MSRLIRGRFSEQICFIITLLVFNSFNVKNYLWQHLGCRIVYNHLDGVLAVLMLTLIHGRTLGTDLFLNHLLRCVGVRFRLAVLCCHLVPYTRYLSHTHCRHSDGSVMVLHLPIVL